MIAFGRSPSIHAERLSSEMNWYGTTWTVGATRPSGRYCTSLFQIFLPFRCTVKFGTRKCSAMSW